MREKIDKVTRVVLVVLMALLVLDVVWQVFTRYVIQSPSTFTDELARFLLIWVSLLGAAYFSGQNLHVAIDMFPRSLNPRNRFRLTIFIKVLIALFVLIVFVIGGGILVYTTWTYLQVTPALQIPMALVYLIGPISGLLIIYYKIDDIYRLIRKGPDHDIRTADAEPSATA
ncbi:TRAP transporter small permease [Balneolales bacterium ANBcel1]|nr:TRAP transporter small permease [Balneolales bacterium ANBcel1]